MQKIMLKLENGISYVEITKEYQYGYEGWLVDFGDGKSAFVRLENGEWVQRLDDQISINDLKSIIDAMQECALI